MTDASKTAAEQARLVRSGRPFADFFAPMLPLGAVRPGAPEVETWAPKIECKRANGNLIVNAELPGLKKDEVKVEITNEGLILEGARNREHAEQREGVYRCERSYGHFYRFVPLPEGAKAEEATAELNDGVLTVTVPLPDVKEHRRAIPVRSGK